MNVVLEHARIVHHDRVDAGPLAFTGGRVASAASADAYHVDLRGHVVVPGLINAHDHLQLNGVPPLGHAAHFANSYEWIDAFAPHLEGAAVREAVSVPTEVRHHHGALKNVLSGATTVAHHDPWHVAFEDAAFPVRVASDSGWSHSLGLGMGVSAAGPRYGPEVVASHESARADRPWVIHLAEGTDDVAGSELRRLDALGCLTANTILVHGVGLSAADLERVIDAGAAVAWCPASNLSMLGRTLDPRRLFDAGRLMLGTDSRLTGSRDLLAELRVATMHSDLSAAELLRVVTHDARLILGLPDVGCLDVGAMADCMILRCDGAAHDALLAADRSSIRAVVRGGRPVIADPDFAAWFAHAGVASTTVCLDGELKLLAREIAMSPAARLEPGLALA